MHAMEWRRGILLEDLKTKDESCVAVVQNNLNRIETMTIDTKRLVA